MMTGIEGIVEIVHSGVGEKWAERNEEAFQKLFGASGGRYHSDASKSVRVRAPEFAGGGVKFAAYIHPANSTSGMYGGMSFVIFPAEEAPCLVAMVVGTGGLAPDELILGRPGHARKMRAICGWLNQEFGRGKQVAWAKHDPTRVDLPIPERLQQMWAEYGPVFEKYGKELYAVYRPTEDREATAAAAAAMLDVMFRERGQRFVKKGEDEAAALRAEWLSHLLDSATRGQVRELLAQRRYVILQGPPGTGKTRLARQLLESEYAGNGTSIQFHPNTTYESFVGGLAPAQGEGAIGLRFQPEPGHLMKAVAEAESSGGKPYLLHIDEINRADLAKVLGEAVFLLEPAAESKRVIDLPLEFPNGVGRRLSLPDNLHILGTMNTADRSIAIVDVAVRRRFAFTSLWPSMEVVNEHGCEPSIEAFQSLLEIFMEHASDDALVLMPGHSYFLAPDRETAILKLKTGLRPLLEEYLAQGYVAGFGESVRSYLQWLESL